MTPDDTADREQQRRGDPALVAALALGASYTDAGAEVGLSKSTVQRRMNEPEFRRQVDELAAVGLERARRIIATATPEAARMLVAMATEPASASLMSPHVRRQAVCEILTRAERGYTDGLIVERVRVLEARLGIE